MTNYDIYPAVDEDFNFPPEVRQATADSQEIKDRIAEEVAPIYMRRWLPNVNFAANEQAVLPDNRIGSAKTDFTTGSVYDSSKWNLVTAIDMVNAATSTGEIVLRTNLATSPNGEIGWVTTSGYSSTYDPTYIRPDGKYGARRWSKSSTDTGKYFPYGRGIGQATTTSSANTPGTINGLAPVVPGKSYGVGLWAVSTIDSPIGSISFRWYDVNGNAATPGSTSSASKSGVAGIPQWYAAVATAPVNAAYVNIEFYLAQTVDGLSVVLNSQTWAWNVLIEQRATAPVAADYIDGSTLQNGSITYKWLGFANQSMSVQMQNDTIIRRSPAGTFEATTPLSALDVANKAYVDLRTPIVVTQSLNNDDTALAQAALDVCKANGGGRVLIPYTGKDWRLSKLYISRNTTFECAPGVVIKRKGGSYGISNIFTGINPLTDNTDPYSGHGNIKIIGGTWDGNILTESYVTTGFNLFYFAGGRDIIVEGVTVRDMVTNHCVDLNGVSNVVIRKCRFLGYKDGTVPGDSIYPRNYVEAIQCSQNLDDSQTVWYPMLGTPSKNILVEHCTFGASGTAGTIAYPAGFGTHTSSNDTLTSNIKIRDCTFEGQSFGAVVGYTYNDLTVTGNTFTNCAYGLKANNFTNGKTWDKTNQVWIVNGPTRKETSGIIFSDNQLFDTTNTDVSILGTNADVNNYWATCNDIAIHDNLFKANTTTKRSGQNVRVLLCKNVDVHDNNCQNAQIGILVDSCVNAKTHDNEVYNTVTYGIQHTKGSTPPGTDSKYCSGNRIYNNDVYSAGSHGIGNNSMFVSSVHGNMVADWGVVTASANGILTSGTDGSLVAGNHVYTSATGKGAAIAVATTSTTNVAVTLNNRISKPDGALITMGTGVNNTYGNLTYATS